MPTKQHGIVDQQDYHWAESSHYFRHHLEIYEYSWKSKSWSCLNWAVLIECKMTRSGLPCYSARILQASNFWEIKEQGISQRTTTSKSLHPSRALLNCGWSSQMRVWNAGPEKKTASCYQNTTPLNVDHESLEALTPKSLWEWLQDWGIHIVNYVIKALK